MNMKRLHFNILPLALLAMVAVLTACEKTFYNDEQYRKEIYLVSDDSNIFGQEYSFGDESVGNLSIYAAGTTAIDHDVNVELEIFPDYLRSYNQRIFGDNYSNYAKALEPSDYKIESMTATLKAGASEPYVKLPIKVIVENLNVDDTYFIPIRIKSVSDYMVSVAKREVLYRIFMKNEYATTKTTTYYTMVGTEQECTESGGIFVPTGVPSSVNSTKVFTPIAKNSIRQLPGSIYSNTPSVIRNQSINVTVHPDQIIDVPVYVEGKFIGEYVKRQKVTLATWQESSTSITVADVDDKLSYYDPETKTFTLNYRYKLAGESVWHFMYEVSTPLSVTN